jgi:hypothetical protein
MLVLIGARIKRQQAAVTLKSQFALMNEGQGLVAVWIREA